MLDRIPPSLTGILVLLAIGIIMSCGDGPAHKQQDTPVENARDPVGMELNAGHKWKLGPHMMAPIRRSQRRLAATSPQELASAGETAALADSLFADLDELVQACDMKGKGHDVLHEWLMPHMGLIQRLERTSTTDSLEVVWTELARSNALFERYFE